MVKRLVRLTAGGLAATVLGSLLACGTGPVELPHRPSFVLILVDTLRADYLGTYGFEGEISPNIDRLAEKSLIFERCYSQAPWTKPAVASLFTSLYPQSHGVVTHRGSFVRRADYQGPQSVQTDALSEEATTLAELLQSNGYSTAAFVANPWIRRDHGFAQGFDVFDESNAGNKTPAGPLLDAASKWLASRSEPGPFFLLLHLMDVHAPYDAPETDYQAVSGSPSLGQRRQLTRREYRQLPPYMRKEPWFETPASYQLENWRGRYAAGVRALDRRLGPFLAELDASGLLDETVLVLTSDHGEQLSEHGRWDHGFGLYEHDVHVPLLVRLPSAESGGRRLQTLAGLVDLLPTLLAMADVEPPPGVAGRDLMRSLRDRNAESNGAAVFFTGVKWKPQLNGLRTGRYKLLTDLDTGTVQLFDLQADPGEKHDLAADQPRVVRRLERRMGAHLADLAAQPGLQSDSAEISDELRKRLESLGYLQ